MLHERGIRTSRKRVARLMRHSVRARQVVDWAKDRIMMLIWRPQPWTWRFAAPVRQQA